MGTAIRRLLLLTVVMIGQFSPAVARPAFGQPPPTPETSGAALLTVPLHFEPNQGQADRAAAFVSRGRGYELALDPTGASLRLNGPGGARTIRLTLNGGHPAASLAAERQTRATVNYFESRDRSRWLRGLPTFEQVRYTRVYPGVDLLFYGNQQRFEYDFLVAPGVDPRQIRVSLTGADRIEIDPSGDLLLRVGNGTIRQTRPVIYQDINGTRREVAGRYRLVRGQEVAFEVGDYDSTQTLVIDPVFEWGQYMANTGGYDRIAGVAVTSKGEVVVAFTEQLDPSRGNIGVAKLDAYGQYMSGTWLGRGIAEGLALDDWDNAHIVGQTDEDNFPTTDNALMPVPPVLRVLGLSFLEISSGNSNGFVTKISPDGQTLLYSSYLGGDGEIGPVGSPFPGSSMILKKTLGVKLAWAISPGNSSAKAVAVRPGTSQVFIAGWTESAAFPTTYNAVDTDAKTTWFFTQKRSAFVAVIDTAMSGELSMRYGTYLGSMCTDEANAIAVDANGEAVVTGRTEAINDGSAEAWFCGSFPVTSAPFRETGHGFLTRLLRPEDAEADYLIYSTYLENPGIAVGLRPGRGADVIESRIGGYDLNLRRVRYNGREPMTVDQTIWLGMGSHAAIATVKQRHTRLPITQVIAFNPSTQLAVMTIPAAGVGALEYLTSIERANAAALAANGSAFVLGLNTARKDLPSLQFGPGSREDGYVAKFEHDFDPTDDGANRIRVYTPETIYTAATSADGALVGFTVTAYNFRTDTYPPAHCRYRLGQPAMIGPNMTGQFPIGESVVTCEPDPARVSGEEVGGIPDLSFSVIVQNQVQWTMPQSIVLDAMGGGTALAQWTAPIATDVHGPLATTCDRPSGSHFPLGTTVVTCRAWGYQHAAWTTRITSTFSVTVRDMAPPAIATDLPASAERVVRYSPTDEHGATARFSATATDAIDGVVPVTCTWAGGSASTFPALALLPLGNSTLTCEASDTRGNKGRSSYTMIVGDLGPVFVVHAAGEADARPLSGLHRIDSERSLDIGPSAFLTRSRAACDTWTAGYRKAHPGATAPACVDINAFDDVDANISITCTTDQAPTIKMILNNTVQAMAFGDVPAWHGRNVTCVAFDFQGRKATTTMAFKNNDNRPATFSNVPADVYAAPGPDGTATIFYALPTARHDGANIDLSVSCGLPSGSAFPMGETGVVCDAWAPGGATVLGRATFMVYVVAPEPGVPDVDFESGPSHPSSSRSARFTFAPRGHGGAVPAAVVTLCSLDDGPFEFCQSPHGYAMLADGPHVFRVKARTLGEAGAIREWHWLVDSAEPYEPSEMPAVILEATGPTGAVVGETSFAMGTTFEGRPYTVIVRDTTPPVLNMLPDQVFEAADQTGINVYFSNDPAEIVDPNAACGSLFGEQRCHVSVGVDLVDGPVPVICSALPATRIPVGVTMVTCSATDRRGNTVNDTFSITVIDPLALAITAPASIRVEAASAAGAAIADDILGAPVVEGGRGALTITRSPAGNVFPIGHTTVVWMAADETRSIVTTEQAVLVVDTTAPALQLPGDMNVAARTLGGAVVDFTVRAQDVVDGSVAVTCAPASGSPFPIGATTVSCMAVDSSGNRNEGRFTVTVKAKTAEQWFDELDSAINRRTLDDDVRRIHRSMDRGRLRLACKLVLQLETAIGRDRNVRPADKAELLGLTNGLAVSLGCRR